MLTARFGYLAVLPLASTRFLRKYSFTHLEREVSALLEHSETQKGVWVSSSPSPTVPALIPGMEHCCSCVWDSFYPHLPQQHRNGPWVLLWAPTGDHHCTVALLDTPFVT